MEPTVLPDSQTDSEGRKILDSMRLSRIILPVTLGLGAVGFLFYKQFDIEQFRKIDWTGRAFLWIGLAFLLLLARHFFIALRLRAITRKVFSWKKYLELIVLWEFSAALTPTSKGGPLVMMFVLTQERLAAGRTAAAVFYAMVCDSGFFVLTLPILMAFYGPSMLYPGMSSFSDVRLASGTFFVTYGIMAAYWLVLVFFLFFQPQVASKGLHWLATRRILKRWSAKIDRLGREFTLAATEIREQNWRYHLSIIGATIAVWTSKFIMINCLIIAIVPSTPVDGGTQAFIYARMVSMFIIMAFSPTPGGAGIAEVAMVGFISDYVPKGIGLIVALLWRGMAYYGYLLVGAFVVPNWITHKIAEARARELIAKEEQP
ncbi:MAG: flippase-like domain-containing protein [Lewinellaceae bacterium]|nr:flippase-like domain-containing protein [Lewinellaceae bacterium]